MLDDGAYFAYYGQLANQQNMLQDSERTGKYCDAINSLELADRTVMDLGAGTGILSIFAARRDARKVHAVEASAAHALAAKLIEANALSDVISVHHGQVEHLLTDGQLSRVQVDFLVSEPIGVLLFHERMVESFLHVRSFYGLGEEQLMPRRGRLSFVPFSEPALYQEVLNRCAFWQTAPSDFYNGIDLHVLHEDALREALASPLIGSADPSSFLSSTPARTGFDFGTMVPADLWSFQVECVWTSDYTGVCHGLAGWFDVDLTDAVVLDTSPWSPRTHWHQCKLLFPRPVALNRGQRFAGSLSFNANSSRSYDLCLEITEPAHMKHERFLWRLQDQQFWSIAWPPSEDGSSKLPMHYNLY
jgi:histone-arginine methyltransferase CARM1